ncbi:MAG: ComEC/Rec2 family competence protein [Paracoccus sp. (in: a-proteobacteria)]|uniref:ComEC/Rec2 family competence protein n=1 Tax=Paracoccus sp. TaxID=267 RepID=UPI0026DECEE8|nr:ComEC/Rec2 family competence protein [Paracoccus sp. (in: a-proteobacteria)]MDO5621122.1 ComEC/Rec2 family competence protein [Paracoccus sp. (in: a-proteobacteria)]
MATQTASAAFAAAPPARQGVVTRAGLFPWVPVWFGLGIGLWLIWPTDPGWPVLAAVVALLLAPGLWWAGQGRLPAWLGGDAALVGSLALALLAAGFLGMAARSASVAAPVLDFRYYGPVEGRVLKIDRSGRDRIRILLDQVVLANMPTERTPARVRVGLMEVPAALPPPGRRVMLTANLSAPPGPAEPGSFDFRRYAWFERLGAVGYTRTAILTVEPEPAGGLIAADQLRMRASAAIQQAIPGQSGAVTAALFTGDRSAILERTNDIMRASNLYHVVSISGLHMALVVGFTYQALRWVFLLAGMGLRAGGWHLNRAPPGYKVAALLAILAGGAYLWISGMDVATQRSFIMAAVMLGAIVADRRAISLRTLAVSALLILMLTPEALTSAGFQMSFAATIGLVLTGGAWGWFKPWLPAISRGFVMLVISSLVAGLATSPIAAAHFGRIPHYGLIANLLAVPVVGVMVMPFGVIATVLAPLGLAWPALWVAGIGTSWMLWVADYVAGLDGATSAVALPPGWVLPLMSGAGLLVVLTLPRLRVVPLAGGLALLVSFVAWMQAARPDILISWDGSAVAVMGPQGRVPSKPSGGAFAISSWLEADGDMAPQAAAAARPGWSGPANARRYDLPEGVLWHMSGKGAADRAAAACQPGAMVVSSEALARDYRPACRLFDQTRLRRSGAVALWRDGAEWRAETSAQRDGGRAWSR